MCVAWRGRTRRRRVGAAGFTLIELVISAALMAMILSAAYACLQAGWSTQTLVHSREEILQNARVAMAAFTADLRAACPISKDLDLVGIHRLIGERAADNLDFATHHYKPRRRGEADWCEASYFLERDRESGRLSLWRRRGPTLDDKPLAGGSREEIAQGLLGLRFEYYDGLEWYDEWGDPDVARKKENSWRQQPNLAGMPEAVRMTLWFDTQPVRRQARSSEAAEAPQTAASEPPLVFQTVARLELAGTLSRSASGGGSSGSSSSPAQSGQPGGGQR
jgi:type II secretion system protein J